jgi:hypothetical protein
MEANARFQLNGSPVLVSSWVCIDGTRCVAVFPATVGKSEVMYAHSALGQGNLFHRMCAVVECLGGIREEG